MDEQTTPPTEPATAITPTPAMDSGDSVGEKNSPLLDAGSSEETPLKAEESPRTPAPVTMAEVVGKGFCRGCTIGRNGDSTRSQFGD